MVAIRRVALPFLAAVPFLVPPARADSSRRNPFSAVPVSGTSADGNAFQGTMDVLGFINENGLKAIGTLTGTITPSTGPAQQVAGAIVLIPVNDAATAAPMGLGGVEPNGTRALRTNGPSVAQATCPILHLDLGPLDLNLLGLTVHLNEVILDITAVPGAGNLLGNLLCAVANLLNGLSTNLLGTALTNVLTQLLNNVVAALAGL
jgi:hypothetical protein